LTLACPSVLRPAVLRSLTLFSMRRPAPLSRPPMLVTVVSKDEEPSPGDAGGDSGVICGTSVSDGLMVRTESLQGCSVSREAFRAENIVSSPRKLFIRPSWLIALLEELADRGLRNKSRSKSSSSSYASSYSDLFPEAADFFISNAPHDNKFIVDEWRPTGGVSPIPSLFSLVKISTKLNFAVCTPAKFVNDFIVVDEFSSRYRVNINIGNVSLFGCLAMGEVHTRCKQTRCDGWSVAGQDDEFWCAESEVDAVRGDVAVLDDSWPESEALTVTQAGEGYLDRWLCGGGWVELRRQHLRGIEASVASRQAPKRSSRLQRSAEDRHERASGDWMSTADVADGVRRASQYCARAGPKLSDESPKTGNATTGEGGSCRNRSMGRKLSSDRKACGRAVGAPASSNTSPIIQSSTHPHKPQRVHAPQSEYRFTPSIFSGVRYRSWEPFGNSYLVLVSDTVPSSRSSTLFFTQPRSLLGSLLRVALQSTQSRIAFGARYRLQGTVEFMLCVASSLPSDPWPKFALSCYTILFRAEAWAGCQSRYLALTAAQHPHDLLRSLASRLWLWTRGPTLTADQCNNVVRYRCCMCRLRLNFWLAFSLLTFYPICRSLLSLHLHRETSPLASGRTSVRNHVVGKLPVSMCGFWNLSSVNVNGLLRNYETRASLHKRDRSSPHLQNGVHPNIPQRAHGLYNTRGIHITSAEKYLEIIEPHVCLILSGTVCSMLDQLPVLNMADWKGLNSLCEEINIQELSHSWRWWHLPESQPDVLGTVENASLTEFLGRRRGRSCTVVVGSLFCAWNTALLLLVVLPVHSCVGFVSSVCGVWILSILLVILGIGLSVVRCASGPGTHGCSSGMSGCGRGSASITTSVTSAIAAVSTAVSTTSISASIAAVAIAVAVAATVSTVAIIVTATTSTSAAARAALLELLGHYDKYMDSSLSCPEPPWPTTWARRLKPGMGSRSTGIFSSGHLRYGCVNYKSTVLGFENDLHDPWNLSRPALVLCDGNVSRLQDWVGPASLARQSQPQPSRGHLWWCW
ncbi:hypothetical protein KCU93_g17, partial [Aureobasidium melanogenum]